MAKTSAQPSKQAFVLGLPLTMPATEVVAKGKAAGVKLTPAHVYTIRSVSRRDGTAKGKKRGNGSEPRRRGETNEARFRSLVLELGLARARGLLIEVETAVERLLSVRPNR